MELKTLIRQRISQPLFTDQPVDIDVIIDLLDTAVYAPNHKMREPWRFIILEGLGKERFVQRYLESLPSTEQEELRKKLTKLFSAPMVVAFVMSQLPDLRDELEDLQAVATVVQNFMLLLTEKGMSSFWKTPVYIESDRFKDLLGLSSRELVTAMIQVGYPEKTGVIKPRISAKLKTTIYK